MFICSCAVVSDHDIELALLDLMIAEDAPLPTPGVVWRHLSKKMDCCGCAPLAVAKIYEKLEALEAKGLICPCACANAKDAKRRAEKRDTRAMGMLEAEAAEPLSVRGLDDLKRDRLSKRARRGVNPP